MNHSFNRHASNFHHQKKALCKSHQTPDVITWFCYVRYTITLSAVGFLQEAHSASWTNILDLGLRIDCRNIPELNVRWVGSHLTHEKKWVRYAYKKSCGVRWYCLAHYSIYIHVSWHLNGTSRYYFQKELSFFRVCCCGVWQVWRSWGTC